MNTPFEKYKLTAIQECENLWLLWLVLLRQLFLSDGQLQELQEIHAAGWTTFQL